MGICVCRAINKEKEGVDNSPNEGDVQDVASTSSESFPRPVMVTKDHFVGLLRETSCYWVYTRFSDQRDSVRQSLYALDIKENRYLRLPDHPMNTYSEDANSVLDSNLYSIGGRRGQFLSSFVHFFDPVLHNWSDTTFTTVSRRAAIAASVNGRIYVFGGCNIKSSHWAEVYDPSTMTWTPIPQSQALSRALDRGLSPLRASAVLGKKIIVRGFRKGIALDARSNSWTAVSNNLIQYWWGCISAAVVQNMIITCHGDNNQPEKFEPCIRAYDPDEDVWLELEGIDSSFHENAYRSEFMAVNGKLVIYNLWEQNELTYSVIEINERLGTTVRASLLWQTQFPIATIINQGLDVIADRYRKSVYDQSLSQALKAEV